MNNAKGFTLIELMIVVAIVAILAAIGYPAYTSSVQKGNRSDGTSFLMEMAQNMERCMSLYGAYNNAACTYQNGTSHTSVKGYYSVAVVSDTDSFTLTATPVSGSPQASDSSCASFVINHIGTKTATASGGAATTTCW